MRVLLDTHAFLWAISEPSRLSETAADVLAEEENQLPLSTVSLWEILLKREAGKLRLPAAAEYFETHMRHLGITQVLPVTPVHVYALLRLPAAHRDPFDRLLAAQCLTEKLVLLSPDPILRQYPIEVLW